MNGCEDLDTHEHCLNYVKNYPTNTRSQSILYCDSNDITKQAAVTKLFIHLLERERLAVPTSLVPSAAQSFPGSAVIIVNNYDHYGNIYIYMGVAGVVLKHRFH